MSAKTTIARESDLPETLAFLDRELLANVWLIQESRSTLSYPTGHTRVLICRCAGRITGVATISGKTGVGFAEGYKVRMSATDLTAADSLLEVFPSSAEGRFRIFNPILQQHIGDMSQSAHLADLYFTAWPNEFAPVEANDVVELTAADACLFEDSECEQPEWEYMGAEHKVFGIICKSRVAALVGWSPVTPLMPSQRRVIAIGALYTDPRHRRRGFARRLVSYATDLVLRDDNLPCYWTEPENRSSQALCLSLGYRHYAQEMHCTWRKK